MNNTVQLLEPHLDYRKFDSIHSGDNNEYIISCGYRTAAFRQWLSPLVTTGELRPRPTLRTTAIVSGPAHSIAQRSLAGNLDRPLTSFLDEADRGGLRLLSHTPAPTPHIRLVPATARVTLELLADDGSVVGRGQTSAQLGP